MRPEIPTPPELLEQEKDVLISRIRFYVNSTEDHHKLELRRFISTIENGSNEEETAGKLASLSESLNSIERLRVIGLIFLYANNTKNGLVAEFLNALSADQFGPEIVMRNSLAADEGFSTKRPLRRFNSDGSWQFRGTQKRLSSETSDRVTGFSEASHQALLDDLNLSLAGNMSASEEIKDFCRLFFKNQVFVDLEAMTTFIQKLAPNQSVYFLGLIMIYASNINTNKVRSAFEAVSMSETKELNSIVEGLPVQIAFKVKQILTI